MNKMNHAIAPLAIITSLLFSTTAFADEWEITLAPYLWAADEKGKVATIPGAPPAKVDVSFDTILENLDMAFMGTFEARKDRLGILADVVYVSIDAGSVKTSGPFFSGAQYEEQIMTTIVAGTYRFTTSNSNIDILAGGRYWEVDNELSLDAGTMSARTLKGKDDWTDVVVGFKSLTKLNKNWSVHVAGLKAVSGDSDDHCEVSGGLNLALSKTTTLAFAYRHLEVEYEKDGFLLDVDFSGPLFGALFVF